MAVVLILLYCLLIVGASIVGGLLPNLIELTHARLQLLMSAIGGFMLGIGLFHLFPHAIVELGVTQSGVDRAVLWLVLGLLCMFFLIRAFHFHQHGLAEVEGEIIVDPDPHASCGEPHAHTGHGEGAHSHHRGGTNAAHAHARSFHHLSWIGVAIGLAVHSLIDGMALGTAMIADAAHATEWSLIGFGTFLAILLHKPLDAVSITSLMAASGWSPGWRQVVNISFAMMCPLGLVIVWFGVQHVGESRDLVIGCLLAFSAGVFLCISLGDLLPEIEFHRHDRVMLSMAVLAGLALAYGIKFLEPEELHSHHMEHAVRALVRCFIHVS